MKASLLFASLLITVCAFGQPREKRSVVIGRNTSKPNALLIVNPQNADQGVLFPQLSTGQRLSLKPSSPAEDGLLVFDTNFQAFYYWSEGTWLPLDNMKKKNHFYSIDPSSFRGLTPGSALTQNIPVVFEAENTFVTVTRDGAGEEIMAPVELPHGAVLKEVAVYYMDNDTDDISIKLMRKTLSGINENILTWRSSGTDGTVKSVVFTDFNGLDSIDLENFTYRFLVAFNIGPEDVIDLPSQALQRIYGVRIKYLL